MHNLEETSRPIETQAVSDYAGIQELKATERNLKRYLRRKCNLIIRFLEGRRIFEVGCGIGTYTRLFSDRGYEVVACDTSSACLREAEKRGYLRRSCRSTYVTLVGTASCGTSSTAWR